MCHSPFSTRSITTMLTHLHRVSSQARTSGRRSILTPQWSHHIRQCRSRHIHGLLHRLLGYTKIFVLTSFGSGMSTQRVSRMKNTNTMAHKHTSTRTLIRTLIPMSKLINLHSLPQHLLSSQPHLQSHVSPRLHRLWQSIYSCHLSMG